MLGSISLLKLRGEISSLSISESWKTEKVVNKDIDKSNATEMVMPAFSLVNSIGSISGKVDEISS